MKKNITIALVIILATALLAGCGTSTTVENDNAAENTSREIVREKNGKGVEYETWGGIGGGYVYTFQDPETNVWYFAYRDGGITPRYNADGTLYTGEQ